MRGQQRVSTSCIWRKVNPRSYRVSSYSVWLRPLLRLPGISTVSPKARGKAALRAPTDRAACFRASSILGSDLQTTQRNKLSSLAHFNQVSPQPPAPQGSPGLMAFCPCSQRTLPNSLPATFPALTTPTLCKRATLEDLEGKTKLFYSRV